jgi:hypothetical protein
MQLDKPGYYEVGEPVECADPHGPAALCNHAHRNFINIEFP